MLQADFLLIASREDIDSSSAWNQALLEAVPSAFLKAILEFTDGDLRYTWMRYLPSRNHFSDFFEKLEPEILRLLSETPILENFAGILTTPSKLRSVPVHFTDENGIPLIITKGTMATYISQNYVLEDHAHLARIGVGSLSAEEFLADLKNFIHKSPRNFQEMSKSWHSSLANALSRVIHDFPQTKSMVMALEIIPICDGSWISASRGAICFSDTSYSLAVPKGVEIYEIHPDASWGQFRRSLFINLGAKTFSKDLVCEAIVRGHEDSQFDPKRRSTSELISHIMFLYIANWTNTGAHDLYLATECDTVCLGSEIYLDSDEPYSASILFKGTGRKLRFLHKHYIQSDSTTDFMFKS